MRLLSGEKGPWNKDGLVGVAELSERLVLLVFSSKGISSGAPCVQKDSSAPELWPSGALAFHTRERESLSEGSARELLPAPP